MLFLTCDLPLCGEGQGEGQGEGRKGAASLLIRRTSVPVSVPPAVEEGMDPAEVMLDAGEVSNLDKVFLMIISGIVSALCGVVEPPSIVAWVKYSSR